MVDSRLMFGGPVVVAVAVAPGVVVTLESSVLMLVDLRGQINQLKMYCWGEGQHFVFCRNVAKFRS